MSLYYEKSDVVYQYEVLNPNCLSSIRGAYLSQSRAKKNNNVMQCAVCSRSYNVALYIYKANTRNVFVCLPSTVDDSGSNVASALSDSKYTRMSLAHAHCSSHILSYSNA